MHLVILGDGPLGQAVARGAAERGDRVTLHGRPADGRHPRPVFRDADVVVEASRGSAVAANLDDALAAGARAVVIATTGWTGAGESVDERLRAVGAAAVASTNFSLGAALFARLVDVAAELYGASEAFEPFLVEWHRKAKTDRPSGTALDLARRLADHHPRLDGPTAVETVSIRAGESPGMHLVGFDALGETVELRLTARDRSAYAVGILAAADWLERGRRSRGLHPFDDVVDTLLARPLVAA